MSRFTKVQARVSTASGQAGRGPARRLWLVLAVLALGVVGLVPAAQAVITPAGALAISTAMASPSANVTGASFVSVTGGTPNGISTTPLGGFPTNGASYGILTTGNVSSVPVPASFASTDNGGAPVRGDTDHDVTIMKTDISVPAGANCLTFDFKFLSEEYPFYVGSQYNDAFIAELDSTTWTTSGSVISAPNNFAFDSSHSVVSINSTGLGGMSGAAGAGTAFDGVVVPGQGNGGGGATGLLHATTPVTPGAHSIFFSLFDQGDNIYDSAVFLDNLVVGFVNNPAVNCKPGAVPVTFNLTLTPATATNPAGTQHTVTATLTNSGTPVSNAPIAFTVTGPNATTGTGTTNTSGQATFTYTGNNVGHDVITACYDANSSPPCEATASATKDWTPVSDVGITKDGPANAVVGGPISYTLTATNHGPTAATNVVVSDPVPAGTTLVSATPSQGTCDTTVSCNLGGLANGGSATIVIVVTATAAGTVTNTATVSATEPDPNSANNTATATTTVYGFAPGGGSFVIGDGNRANGTAVTFWGSQWWKANTLSGGDAPSSFKGFAVNSAPTCNTTWSTDPGNSAPPPAGPLPAFMAVLVTSSSTKSGSQISGNTTHIVIVQTDPGYAGNPGHDGTGTVVAQIC